METETKTIFRNNGKRRDNMIGTQSYRNKWGIRRDYGRIRRRRLNRKRSEAYEENKIITSYFRKINWIKKNKEKEIELMKK